MNKCTLKMIREEITDYDGIEDNEDWTLNSVDNVVRFLTTYAGLHEEPEEVFCVIGLNTKHKLTDFWVVSRGSLNESLVTPREAFKRLIIGNSLACILAHSHPSGDVTPSPCDMKMTKRMTDAGKLLGIEVLDHVIIGDGFYSFAREGII